MIYIYICVGGCVCVGACVCVCVVSLGLMLEQLQRFKCAIFNDPLLVAHVLMTASEVRKFDKTVLNVYSVKAMQYLYGIFY